MSTSHPHTHHPHHRLNLRAQLVRNVKYVLGGLVGCWYLGVEEVISDVLGTHRVGGVGIGKAGKAGKWIR
jgi:hypothetical protein